MSLQQFLDHRMSDGQISATTLVFTFFCDVVTQHGGEIWLGHVIRVLAPLGINERLTRTAVFRLVKEGWLDSRKQGRRSFYRLSPTGRAEYQRAAQRIYASSQPEWDGHWTLVFTSQVSDDKREILRRGLSWLGYGRLANSVYALPCYPHTALIELLTDLGCSDEVMCMRAEADHTENLQSQLTPRWKLGELEHQYRSFVDQYQQAISYLESSQSSQPHMMLLLRVLLIHEYRKILLSDPELPIVMLPPRWPGIEARSLTATLYRSLAERTDSWIRNDVLKGPHDSLAASPEQAPRFPVVAISHAHQTMEKPQ